MKLQPPCTASTRWTLFAVGGTAVLLLIVALPACLVPALRASCGEPMIASRDE